MTTKIALSITNPNNSAYPTIILRKFFNMAFVEPDGRTLNIYTATVFGGGTAVDVQNPGNRTVPPDPQPVKESQCLLKFKYSISGEQAVNPSGKVWEDISFSDLSDQYIAQKDEIKKVWKNVSDLAAQTDIQDALVELYPHIYKSRDDVNIPDIASLGTVLKIEGNLQDPKSHSCVACKGKYQKNKENKTEYTLTSSQVKGIEAINWIKTRIKLKKSILEATEKIEFSVTFGGNTAFYTPDFTWYFAPPTSYVVDSETAVLTIGTGKGERNRVASVADATTVLFKEWDKTEAISERKKSRVNFSEMTARDAYIFTKSKITVLLSFVNPGKHGNLQFFIGLVVAFLLSYCSDKTRLNDFLQICQATICGEEECLSLFGKGQCCCSTFCNFLGIAFPVLIIFAFFAISFSRKRCLPSNVGWRRFLGGAKVLGLVATISLAVYIYFGWLVVPGLVKNVITSCRSNQIAILILMVMSLLGNGIYVLYCWLIKKKNIVDFF